ncbi:hypothetical protein G6F50_016779 [Rhizopus delemar]|uniref:Uncharacterized protein n=1 Tax=Rhizopus delemar TaxID=936053 RepID=A0A9P6XS31_9FUNG|nr:hypothetical protein G6F50_016779 [Rhizopus delemar]
MAANGRRVSTACPTSAVTAVSPPACGAVTTMRRLASLWVRSTATPARSRSSCASWFCWRRLRSASVAFRLDRSMAMPIRSRSRACNWLRCSSSSARFWSDSSGDR